MVTAIGLSSLKLLAVKTVAMGNNTRAVPAGHMHENMRPTVVFPFETICCMFVLFLDVCSILLDHSVQFPKLAGARSFKEGGNCKRGLFDLGRKIAARPNHDEISRRTDA